MNELVTLVVVVLLLFGGIMTDEKIFTSTRKAALAKASHGLPKMTPFANALTKKKNRTNY